jgi:hypothetical protein
LLFHTLNIESNVSPPSSFSFRSKSKLHSLNWVAVIKNFQKKGSSKFSPLFKKGQEEEHQGRGEGIKRTKEKERKRRRRRRN